MSTTPKIIIAPTNVALTNLIANTLMSLPYQDHGYGCHCYSYCHSQCQIRAIPRHIITHRTTELTIMNNSPG